MIHRFIWLTLAALMLLASLPNNANAQASNNLGGVLLKSAAQTATQVNTPAQTNTIYRGMHVIVDVTAYTSGSYTPVIQAQDPASLKWYPICCTSTTPISAIGTTIIKVYPGTVPIAGGSAQDILPKVWRVQLNGLSTPSMTLSVGFNMDL